MTDLNGKAESPAAENIYTIWEECNDKKLDKKIGTEFYHAVALLLFACPRSSKDTQTSIYFFTTRVNDPDEDDWRKLKRLLRYVRRTVNMPPVLRVDSLTIIKWLVNASFATHPD